MSRSETTRALLGLLCLCGGGCAAESLEAVPRPPVIPMELLGTLVPSQVQVNGTDLQPVGPDGTPAGLLRIGQPLDVRVEIPRETYEAELSKSPPTEWMRPTFTLMISATLGSDQESVGQVVPLRVRDDREEDERVVTLAGQGPALTHSGVYAVLLMRVDNVKPGEPVPMHFQAYTTVASAETPVYD